MVALASSKEEMLEKLKSDIYAKSEIWDFSKVSLYKVEEWMGWELVLIFWLGRSRFIHLSVRLEIHDREDGMGNEGWDGWVRVGMKIGWIDMVKDASKDFQEVHHCSAMPGRRASQCLHFAMAHFSAQQRGYVCELQMHLR
jgi:hypothetical protein